MKQLKNSIAKAVLLLVVFTIGLSVLTPIQVSAQVFEPAGPQKVELLEPELLGFKPNTEVGDLTYLSFLYNRLIFATVILAVVMIMVGGIIYVIPSANPSNKESGKGYILGALGGLMLALLAFIIRRHQLVGDELDHQLALQLLLLLVPVGPGVYDPRTHCRMHSRRVGGEGLAL